MIKVICISEVKSAHSLIKKNKEYLLDTFSIYGDDCGDWSVETYKLDETYLGRFYLKHFMSKTDG